MTFAPFIRIAAILALLLASIAGTAQAQSAEQLRSVLLENVSKANNITMLGKIAVDEIRVEQNAQGFTATLQNVKQGKFLNIAQISFDLTPTGQQGQFALVGRLPASITVGGNAVALEGLVWQGQWSLKDQSYSNLNYAIDKIALSDQAGQLIGLEITKVRLDISSDANQKRGQLQLGQVYLETPQVYMMTQDIVLSSESDRITMPLFDLAEKLYAQVTNEQLRMRERLAQIGAIIEGYDFLFNAKHGFSMGDTKIEMVKDAAKDHFQSAGFAKLVVNNQHDVQQGAAKIQQEKLLQFTGAYFSDSADDSMIKVDEFNINAQASNFSVSDINVMGTLVRQLGENLTRFENKDLSAFQALSATFEQLHNDHNVQLSYGFKGVSVANNAVEASIEAIELGAEIAPANAAKVDSDMRMILQGVKMSDQDSGAQINLDSLRYDINTDGIDLNKFVRAISRVLTGSDGATMADLWDYVFYADSANGRFALTGLDVKAGAIALQFGTLAYEVSLEDMTSAQGAVRIAVTIEDLKTNALGDSLQAKMLPQSAKLDLRLTKLAFEQSRAALAQIPLTGSLLDEAKLKQDIKQAGYALLPVMLENLPTLVIEPSHYTNSQFALGGQGTLTPDLESPLFAQLRMNSFVSGAGKLETMAKAVLSNQDSNARDKMIAQYIMTAMLAVKGFVDTAQLAQEKWDFEIILDGTPNLMINYVPVPGFDRIWPRLIP